MQSKRCFDCKQTKVVSEFYKCIGTLDGYNDRCIACARIYGKKQRRYDRIEVVQPGEIAAIDKLKSLGIYVAPGKCSEFKWVDVVAWGCVRIEVKYTTVNDTSKIQWHLGRKDPERWNQIDLVMLISDINDDKNFYILPADSPIFFKPDGKAKLGVVLYMTPKYVRGPVRETILSAKDRFDLIEEVRLNKVAALLEK